MMKIGRLRQKHHSLLAGRASRARRLIQDAPVRLNSQSSFRPSVHEAAPPQLSQKLPNDGAPGAVSLFRSGGYSERATVLV
jgi:hypothetical protein